MLKVALTGGIATGKTRVLSRLRNLGVPTIDADDIVHGALAAGTDTTRAIALEFGHAALSADGSVDRAVLASKVFDDADARGRLEAIVHPFVYRTIRDWLQRVDRRLAVASIPLLFETHHEADFDKVVVTACRPEQQMERMQARGLTEDEARRRLAAQMPTDDKVKRADFVIWTSGTTLETDAQVDELLMSLERED